jgi:hypothetical protein
MFMHFHKHKKNIFQRAAVDVQSHTFLIDLQSKNSNVSFRKEKKIQIKLEFYIPMILQHPGI